MSCCAFIAYVFSCWFFSRRELAVVRGAVSVACLSRTRCVSRALWGVLRESRAGNALFSEVRPGPCRLLELTTGMGRLFRFVPSQPPGSHRAASACLCLDFRLFGVCFSTCTFWFDNMFPRDLVCSKAEISSFFSLSLFFLLLIFSSFRVKEGCHCLFTAWPDCLSLGSRRFFCSFTRLSQN